MAAGTLLLRSKEASKNGMCSGETDGRKEVCHELPVPQPRPADHNEHPMQPTLIYSDVRGEQCMTHFCFLHITPYRACRATPCTPYSQRSPTQSFMTGKEPCMTHLSLLYSTPCPACRSTPMPPTLTQAWRVQQR
eukprot:1160224-Pelagomonas_calceolata.AAC.9